MCRFIARLLIGGVLLVPALTQASAQSRATFTRTATEFIVAHGVGDPTETATHCERSAGSERPNSIGQADAEPQNSQSYRPCRLAVVNIEPPKAVSDRGESEKIRPLAPWTSTRVMIPFAVTMRTTLPT